MDIFTSIFAGLGLFFMGSRLIGSSLTQLAGRRLRKLIGKATASRTSLVLLGLASGIVMQSVNAVIQVLEALVMAGALERQRAFPLIIWSNIGASTLVLVALLSVHTLSLMLVGLVGLTLLLRLDQSAHLRHAVGLLMGLGLMFLGIDFMKSGSAMLSHAMWFEHLLLLAGKHLALSFALGVVVTAVTQSATVATVVAMAMAAAGSLTFESGAMVTVGTFVGSAIATWSTSGKHAGSIRQLMLFQITVKILGVLVMLPVLMLDMLWGGGHLQAALAVIHLSPSAQLAAVYMALQLASVLAMHAAQGLVERWLDRIAPHADADAPGQVHAHPQDLPAGVQF